MSDQHASCTAWVQQSIKNIAYFYWISLVVTKVGVKTKGTQQKQDYSIHMIMYCHTKGNVTT